MAIFHNGALNQRGIRQSHTILSNPPLTSHVERLVPVHPADNGLFRATSHELFGVEDIHPSHVFMEWDAVQIGFFGHSELHVLVHREYRDVARNAIRFVAHEPKLTPCDPRMVILFHWRTSFIRFLLDTAVKQVEKLGLRELTFQIRHILILVTQYYYIGNLVFVLALVPFLIALFGTWSVWFP